MVQNTFMAKNSILVDITDLKDINNILKAIKLLNKKLINIRLCTSLYIDIDTNYYHRIFNEKECNNFYNFIKNNSNDLQLTFKNNRLYTNYKEKIIILPTLEKFRNLYDNECVLSLLFNLEY